MTEGEGGLSPVGNRTYDEAEAGTTEGEGWFRSGWKPDLRQKSDGLDAMIDTGPVGFRGLDPALPVTIYRRHLPHWRQRGATYFVTFRLADSLPQSCLDELTAERAAWIASHPEPDESELSEFARRGMQKIERWLDDGHGRCALAEPAAQDVVTEALLHFDGDRYELFAFAIMPNHVHVVVRPLGEHTLEGILQAWKRHTALAINRLQDRSGPLWQKESYDRIVRDADHLRRVVAYVLRNPERIGRKQPAWLCEAWKPWFAPHDERSTSRQGGSSGSDFQSD